MTGTFNGLQINDIGSPYVHKRHKVGVVKIGKSKMGRAVVYDQHLIDNLYLDNLITDREHMILDKYLYMIAKSGAFLPSCFPSDIKIFTGGYNSELLPRSVMLVRVQRFLREETSNTLEQKFWKLMIRNPKTYNDLDVAVVQRCGNALQSYWYVNQQSPVSLFQQAIASQPI